MICSSFTIPRSPAVDVHAIPCTFSAETFNYTLVTSRPSRSRRRSLQSIGSILRNRYYKQLNRKLRSYYFPPIFSDLFILLYTLVFCNRYTISLQRPLITALITRASRIRSRRRSLRSIGSILRNIDSRPVYR